MHLHKDKKDAEIRIENCALYSTNRNYRSHSRVLMYYIENNLAADTEILQCSSNGTNEMLSLYITAINLVVSVAYRPQNTTQCHFQDIINRLHHTLENLPALDTKLQLLRRNWESLEVEHRTIDEKTPSTKTD